MPAVNIKDVPRFAWRGVEGGIAAAKSKHDVVMSPTTHCYIDYYQSVNAGEPKSIGGFVPMEKVYSFDPVPAEFTPEEAQYVIGAQVNLWTEYVASQRHAEYMIYPRLCALAEMCWTPQTARNYTDFRARMDTHAQRMDAMGIGYRSLALPVEAPKEKEKK